MLKFYICYIHGICYGSNEKNNNKRHNIILWAFYFIIYHLCEIVMEILLQFEKFLNIFPHKIDGNKQLIVSLTTFPKRINGVWKTIDSLFYQTVKPSKIFLYLSEDDFPRGKDSLPNRLLEYEKRGLTIEFVKDNIMPHKKYLYAMQTYKDSCIVTVDDDIYYNPDTIQKLWSLHKKHPMSVCANTANIIQIDRGGVKPYRQWTRVNHNTEPSKGLVAIGYNGVLYPPKVFKSNNAFSLEQIKRLALNADDLWLKIHETLNNVKVCCGEYHVAGLNLIGASKFSLYKSNCKRGENDIQWNKLCEFYNLSSLDFKDDS